jgi:hypothetical protein
VFRARPPAVVAGEGRGRRRRDRPDARGVAQPECRQGGFLVARLAPSVSDVGGRSRGRELVDGSVDDPLAPFGLHPDKRHVFSPDEQAAVSFAVLVGVAVASGDGVT